MRGMPRYGGRKPRPTGVLSSSARPGYLAGKGDRYNLCRAGHRPQVGRGPFRQIGPVPFSLQIRQPPPAGVCNRTERGQHRGRCYHVDSNAGKGDRYNLREAGHRPQVGRGPFRQIEPVPFSLRSTRGTRRPPGNGPKDGTASSPPVSSRPPAPARCHGHPPKSSYRYPQEPKTARSPGKDSRTTGPFGYRPMGPALQIPVVSTSIPYPPLKSGENVAKIRFFPK